MPTDRSSSLSRRTMIAGALLTVASAATPSFAAPAKSSEIRTDEYWAQEGETKLYLYRKRTVEAGTSGKRKPVLFLAHGSSVSAVPSFDLHVPGHGEFSMMDVFARAGFDVWAIDFEGYGKSSHTGGNSDIARGAQNIQLAVKRIQTETGQQKFHFYGESSGALRIGMYMMMEPEHVLTLGLASLSYTGEGSPTLLKRKESLPFLSTHDRRPRDREMIRSIFTRDKAGTYDPAVPEAMADLELKLTDSVPTGSYVDMTTKLPMLDPKKMTCPLILLRGEDDGIATEEDVLNFFKNVATSSREYHLIPGATHALGWGNQREVSWYALRTFLQGPMGTQNIAG